MLRISRANSTICRHGGSKSVGNLRLAAWSISITPGAYPHQCRRDVPLCGLIVDALLQDIDRPAKVQTPRYSLNSHSKGSIQHLQSQLLDKPIYLRPNYDPIKPNFPGDGAHGSWHVRGLKAFVPVHGGVLTARIRLYAARGKACEMSECLIC